MLGAPRTRACRCTRAGIHEWQIAIPADVLEDKASDEQRLIAVRKTEYRNTQSHAHFNHTRSSDGRLDTGSIPGDAILVAAGRAPNIEGLNLEAAGIGATPRGDA